MKLNRINIYRLPGINQPFEIESAGAGFHVVFGPNGIGKSSICRAIESLYWEDRGPSQRISVNGEFELDGEAWWAERENSRVRWQRGGEDCAPPSLPASHNHRCFFLRLRDLIDPSPDGTHDIASEIRRQMSGGFDLDQIASDLFAGVGARHGRRERNEFNKASQDVQEAEGKQSVLQRRADQLDVLREQLDGAESGALRLTSVERALGLSGRQVKYARIAEEVAVLPECLANFTGKEAEQIDVLQGQIAGLNDRARTLEGQRDVASNTKRESRLSVPLAQAELTVWREKADELGRVELALQAAKTERSVCRKELEAALSALGGSNVDDVSLDLTHHGQLFEFLRAVEAHKTKINVIEEKLRLLEQVDCPEDSQRDVDKFRSATDALRSWLRAPKLETLSDTARTRRSWVILALVMAVVGTGLAILIDPMFTLLAAAGAGVAVPVFMLRNLKSISGARETARDAFGKLGIKEPDAWDIPSVESRLRSLEGEIATLDAKAQRALIRASEKMTLNNELDGLSEAEVALNARRQNLVNSLKLNAILPDAELVDFARALDQFRSTRIKDEGVAGKVDDHKERHARILSDLTSVLESYDEPQPQDATTAGAYLNSLSDRNQRFVQATSDEQRATDQLEQVSTDRDVAINSIKKIYSEASLDDEDLQGLKALLNLLPQYLDLKSTAARLESQIELDRAELAKAGESGLAECDGPSLERLQSDLSQTANKAADLRDQIAEINAQVKDAKFGSNIQDLIGVRDELRVKLQDRRNEALFVKAGKFLIDAVEEEYEQTQLPRVLERARSHFSSFTHHNYELRMSKEAKTPRLLAIDLRSGEGRTLDELSDGTRAQLLLAARIAFAEEVEQGKIMPLFLDEALDQSDPARFEAIVRSLGRLSNDQGRQIFYLTSDPLDVDLIQRALAEENLEIASEIDVGLIRTKAASVRDERSLLVGLRPAVPELNALSAEEYGVALGIPAFKPALGFAEQHFFYVLSDDLNLLHDFLVYGIERAGQWKTVSGTKLAEKLCCRSMSSQEIELRLGLLEFFCELWKQGRGLIVDREALESSGSLSERYLDNVVEIADELGGDPETLISFLATGKDPRTKGFRKNNLESLELYLRENRYLDDLPVLSEEELRLRAFASPAANQLSKSVASECLNRWWAWSTGLLEHEL